jgi:hypothetical protein
MAVMLRLRQKGSKGADVKEVKSMAKLGPEENYPE